MAPAPETREGAAGGQGIKEKAGSVATLPFLVSGWLRFNHFLSFFFSLNFSFLSFLPFLPLHLSFFKISI